MQMGFVIFRRKEGRLMGDRSRQHFGQYRLIRQLGAGGFAEVYLGKHLISHAYAAIKILVGPHDIAQFKREAQIIMQLDYPGIVEVLEYGEENGVPFYVMPFYKRGNLRQLYPKGMRLPWNVIVNLTRQVANALQHAHDQKILHRDVKPHNLLIDDFGQVVLSDFGIATIAHSTKSMTAQEIVGTSYYMSPEQFQGRMGKPGDQYSLGVVVYEWLSGDVPFTGSNFMEVGMKHLLEQPPVLHSRCDVPAGVEAVVLRALAKDPTQRFPTVKGFAQALEQAVNAIFAPTVVPLQQERAVSMPSRAVNPAAAVPGPKVLQLPEHIVCQFPRDGSGNSSSIGKKLFTYEASLGSVEAIAWSPIMTQVAIGTPEGNVVILDPYAGTTIAEYKHGDRVAHIMWSTYGKFIASAGQYIFDFEPDLFFINGRLVGPGREAIYGSNVKVWDILSGEEVLSLDIRGHEQNVWWSPDGNFLATGAHPDRSGFRIWDMQNLRSKDNPTSLDISGLELEICHFQWLPDSRAFFGSAMNKVKRKRSMFYGTIQNGQWTISEHALASQDNRLGIPRHLADKILNFYPFDRPSFSWITRRLARRSDFLYKNEHFIEIYDPYTGSKPLGMLEHSGDSKGRSFAWSPDGTILAYNLHEGNNARFLHFRPDPTRRTGNGGTVWNMERFVLQATDHSSEIYAIYWAADGKVLATTDHHSHVDIWQIDLRR